MKIYLMQHGEAKPKQVDPERALSVQGQQDVQKIADFINQSEMRVNRIIHSGKLRAQQTAEIISAKITTATTEISSCINPNDDVIDFLEEIDNTEDELLVVGHLPFLSKLVTALVTGSDNDLLRYQPASIVCLERDDQECWLINWMLRPELLAG
ncbi:MAG: phosphohistidine phosphatase SixA [Gammaproteobacteria bacterium]|nr:phosphohistidine phosphatase SixA [Gammaproteobacteria bacterium]MCW8910065.1 phosphohistidine phosphatase SixA [Gammaproteobacteria bacterium]MCW9004817.1 phosphohistidine phosphatase SixA [Gammaproteobacteria bacterium]